MKIQTTFGIWYIVEVDGETHYIPPGCVYIPVDKGETLTLKDEQENATKWLSEALADDVKAEIHDAWLAMLKDIQPFIERKIKDPTDVEIEAWEGFGAQYHMPGYMDQTDWVLGDTEEEAIANCKDLYGDEEEEKEEESDEEDGDNPVYAGEFGCEFLRKWEEGDFTLLLWDTNTRVASGPQERLAYEFYHKGELIFSGADYGCSPMHAVDSDECLAALLSFLALRPGDTDREHFADYTPRQLAFAMEHGEELSMLAIEMEENARKDKEIPF